MRGQDGFFMRYMNGAGRFIIPVYQRNYDWKEVNCERLYNDLIKTINTNRNHFFGSIVSVQDPERQYSNEFLIIDGQQRFTTVSLLLLAMYKLMETGEVTSNTKFLKDRILGDYLTNKWDPEDVKIRLKPVKNDREALKKLLFSDPSEYIRESNLTINYNYFYNRIKANKEGITVDQLFDAINRLVIIDVSLIPEDDPQLVFESLNSTGLNLSEGDKIRNFILMKMKPSEQEKYYENYWNKIETCTKYQVSSFIRDYLSVKQKAIPTEGQVYNVFKSYVEVSGVQMEDLLSDMLTYAKRYEKLIDGKTGCSSLDACIDRLKRMKTKLTRPYYLEVCRLFDEGKLTIDQVSEIFIITENYLFRRTICQVPSNALNKIFLSLHSDIINYDGTDNDYVEKFKCALLSKGGQNSFPNDDEFKKAFSELIYRSSIRERFIYILERFENFDTKEDKDIYRHCDDGTYTIEHIMPQTLNPVWKKELGNNHEQIHQQWVDRIANLTLTAYNSNYSNRSFEEKKNMRHGFAESGLRSNQLICQKEKWTHEELEERNNYMIQRALKIWEFPSTTYKPKEKQYETCTLEDEDLELTKRKPIRATFKNTPLQSKNLSKVFQSVIRCLYEEDKTIITKMAVSEECTLVINPQSTKQRLEIGDGIYISSVSNNRSKLQILRKLFKEYNEDPSDLVFYLRVENEK